MSAKDVVAAFEETIQACWRGEREIADVLEFIDEDLELIEADSLPYAGVFRGHEGFLELGRIFGETWEFLPGKTFDYLDDDRGRVIVLTNGRAIARATGTEVEWRLAELFTVRDGLIVQIRPFYWDTAALVAATTPD